MRLLSSVEATPDGKLPTGIAGVTRTGGSLVSIADTVLPNCCAT
jgi:hypothetical protein